jgi:hypothetical protein
VSHGHFPKKHLPDFWAFQSVPLLDGKAAFRSPVHWLWKSYGTLPSYNKGLRPMSLETTAIVALLSNKVVLEVFKNILEKRSVQFKEILSSKGLKEGEEREQLEGAVKVLKEAELIKERPALIEDFNTYYITADGLSVARQLRRADSSIDIS